MPAEFVATLKTHQVPAGGLAVVDVRGTPIAVADVAGTFYAFDDTCTHEQCSLAEGDLAGTTITCMCHGAEFDVRTGAVLAHLRRSRSRSIARVSMAIRCRSGSDGCIPGDINEGRIDAAVGLNRSKDVRPVMPLIKSRRALNLDQLRDEAIDLRALQPS